MWLFYMCLRNSGSEGIVRCITAGDGFIVAVLGLQKTVETIKLGLWLSLVITLK